MRREISEPKHWRSQATRSSSLQASRMERRRARIVETIPVEAVDAAFALDSVKPESVHGSHRAQGIVKKIPAVESTSQESTPANPALINSLTTQLSLLEAQHEQLVQLLAQAQCTLD